MEALRYTVIKSKAQYDSYCALLEEILFSDRSAEREDEVELLTLLIGHYDAQQRESISEDPVTLIKALMQGHGLSQNDLAAIVNRSKGYVSEILNRKKALPKDVIRILSAHFKISQEALNRPYGLTMG
ncbi:HTH-type transcriptional regulator / antitoxin HigA [Cyclonatronum proteinivorum]|uniref:HTH-type transcriptional regulator / antitoxin HigA n=1 Tax=Cyclonatronum proteinivorum TaxID=1457365 RepID=A0A345UJA8_9BACT|nr:helix-turn-helix domain-containing protein [Cyclonatronum proteinivorum]AXJ00560.1 HTH-type transcriptional regulator / antitoxin HigA [Cyclonatronum proteinivorum]